jgi:hypothetical protein
MSWNVLLLKQNIMLVNQKIQEKDPAKENENFSLRQTVKLFKERNRLRFVGF